MVRSALRALLAEPRPLHPPVRVWRDWALVAVLVSWSVIETKVRHDLAWRPAVLTVSLVIVLALLWRRTHPLGAVAVAFGTLIAFDVARIFAIDGTGLNSIVAVLVNPGAIKTLPNRRTTEEFNQIVGHCPHVGTIEGYSRPAFSSLTVGVSI